jgi:CRP-like cAMP-binding protein/di/tricarboxylate transporter
MLTRPPGLPVAIGAAQALAAMPFFATLGPVDLARLVPELEERVVQPGEIVFRQGDPGDGLYLIRSGSAGVSLAEPAGSRVVAVLSAPAYFGEMALLSAEPRSASIIAFTQLALWKLPRWRFEALISRQPLVLRQVAAELTRRLSETTRQLASSEQAGAAMARTAYRALEPAAQMTLRRSAVLAELDLPLLRALDGADVVTGASWLAPESGFLRPGRRDGWFMLAHASLRAVLLADLEDELGERGVEDLRARAAAALLARDDLSIWDVLELLRDADDWCGLANLLEAQGPAVLTQQPERLRALIRALPVAFTLARPGLNQLLAAEAVLADGSPRSIVAEGSDGLAGSILVGLKPSWPGPRLLTLIATIGLVMLAWSAPPPPGLSPAGLRVMVVLVAVLLLGFLNLLPDYVLALVMLTAWVLSGTLPARVALSGFASSSWMLLLASTAIGVAVARSGLLYRLAIEMLRRLPASHAVRCAILASFGMFFSAGMSSATGRLALASPLAIDIAEALRYRPRSGGTVALSLATFIGFGLLGTVFLTGSSPSVLVYGLLPADVQAQMSFGVWFLAALPIHLIVGGLTLALLVRLYRPTDESGASPSTLALQQAVLGRVTRIELGVALIVVLFVVSLVTQPLHGLPPAWLAMLAVAAAFLVGALDDQGLRNGINWGMLLYLGIMLGFGEIFAQVQLEQWLAQTFGGLTAITANSPELFVLVAALVGTAIGLALRSGPGSAVLSLALYPTAVSVGVNPWVIGLVFLLTTNFFLYPAQNVYYLTAYYGTGERGFSHAQARPIALAYAAFTFVALVLTLPYWRWLGLLQ